MMQDQCSEKCCFIRCADDLNNVITKATLYQVKQFVATHCHAALLRRDSVGRLPLHVAASCGKVDVLRWLISHYSQYKSLKNVDINSVDEESGWSALHRAIYYGRLPCASLLLKSGANLWIKDKDDCTVLDFIMKDIAPWLHELICKRNSDVILENWSELRRSGPSDVYTWGTNENMTLANERGRSREAPEPVTTFIKKALSVKQVVICKFHSLFLMECGAVFTCGTGRGGRLGIPKDGIFIEPQPVNFDSKIAMAAAAMHHTVFVSENGQVFTCGLNHFRTLGINPPPQKNDRPQRLSSLRDHHVVGCAAGLCHTVVWSSNALFTFGTNAGQLGHAKGELFIVLPRQVTSLHRENDKFIDVNACDTAAVVATAQGMVYLLQNFACRKIINKHMDISRVIVGGGKLDQTVLSQVKFFETTSHSIAKNKEEQKSEDRDIRVLIMKNSGDLLSWSSSHGTTDHCRFDTKQVRWIQHAAISNNGSTLLFATAEGHAYFGKYSSWKAGKKRSSSHKQEFFSRLDLVNSDSVQEFHLDQIPCAFRCHFATLGPTGRNAAIVQCRPANFITQVPSVDAKNLNENLEEFHRTAADTDLIHDVIIKVKRSGKSDVIIPAHLFILACRSHLLSNLVTSRLDSLSVESSEQNRSQRDPWPHLVVENVHLEILKDVLRLLYRGKCDINDNDGGDFINLGVPLVYWEHQRSLSTSEFARASVNPRKPKNSTKIATASRRSLISKLVAFLGVQDVNRSFNNATGHDDENGSPIVTSGFYRTSFPRLHDCEIICDDSVSFSAHKCILAARIPYFQGMLFSPWLESGDLEIPQLKVPIPSDIFRYVLDFAYCDNVKSISGVSSLEKRCELLAAADLLLMDGLKQVAETQIVPLLTLKNVSMVVDVASAFNASQLYDSCMQFSCHHLAALLQTPSFHNLEMETLEKLEDVYRSMLPYVYTRAMPPSASGPSVDHIPQFVEDSAEGDDFMPHQAPKTAPPTSPKRKSVSETHPYRRQLSDKKSLGFLLSDLLISSKRDTEEDLLEKIITKPPEESRDKHPDKKQQTHGPRQAVHEDNVRDHNEDTAKIAAKTARQRKVPEPEQQPSVKGWHMNANTTPTSNQVKFANNMNVPTSACQAKTSYDRSFPQLGAEESKPHDRMSSTAVRQSASTPMKVSNGSVFNSGSTGAALIKRSKKLSKKEKRRLKEQEELDAREKSQSAVNEAKSPPNAWGIPIKTPEECRNTQWSASPLEEYRMATSPIFTSKSPPNHNSGPWQRLPTSPASPLVTMPTHKSNAATSPEKETTPKSLIDIIQSEQKNIERAERTRKKSLAMIQLEDQAMDELKRFYESSSKIEGTIFTVSRLPDHIASEINERRKALLANK